MVLATAAQKADSPLRDSNAGTELWTSIKRERHYLQLERHIADMLKKINIVTL